MIHGPGNKGNLNLLYKFQQRQIPWPLGAYENKRSFCSINNILYVVERLIDDDILPGTYQVADDEPVSTTDLVKLIALVKNKKYRIWSVPVSVIRFFSMVGDILKLPLNTERLKKLTESYVVSNRKLKDALGIKKLPMKSVDGFKMTIRSFK